MTHNAIVLAAGGSLRLGRPKQLLLRGGETLVHRAVRLALETQPSRTLVVTGGNGAAVCEATVDLPAEVVFNSRWQEGLANSLRVAATTLIEDDAPVLILGCDQPALEQDHLRRLLVGAATSSSRCAATSHGGSPGIPVVVNAALLRDAGGLQGDRGLRESLLRLPAGSVYLLQAPELRFDLDTPGDVDEAVLKGLIDRL